MEWAKEVGHRETPKRRAIETRDRRNGGQLSTAPPARRPSPRPAAARHPRPPTPAARVPGASEQGASQVRGACAHGPAPHAAGPGPASATDCARPHAERGLRAPPSRAPPPSSGRRHHLGRPSGSHLRARGPGTPSSNRGATGVLRTCFSLSSAPSWFQRQAASAELPSASMQAARPPGMPSEWIVVPPIFCLMFVSHVCIIGFSCSQKAIKVGLWDVTALVIVVIVTDNQ